MKCAKCGEDHKSKKERDACEAERESLIDAARAEYGSDEVQIDDNAGLSRVNNGGTWVQAWVWIQRKEET